MNHQKQLSTTSDHRKIAWHFLPKDRHLTNGDGRLIKEGMIVTIDGPLELCEHGLHYSLDILDALHYAPGPVLCRVEIGDESIQDTDKGVTNSRKVLWMIDIERTLHEFAIWCVEQALTREREAGREPDPRSWAALETKRQWLNDEITDEELDAAWAAAWATAWDAAWATARDAARAAVRDAAWDAAWAAARDAAWDAAWDAVRDTQRKQLLTMIETARAKQEKTQ